MDAASRPNPQEMYYTIDSIARTHCHTINDFLTHCAHEVLL